MVFFEHVYARASRSARSFASLIDPESRLDIQQSANDRHSFIETNNADHLSQSYDDRYHTKDLRFVVLNANLTEPLLTKTTTSRDCGHLAQSLSANSLTFG